MLEIARAAFLREGYAAASMSEIAAKVGGSKATLYSYFPSKKDLFAAVIEEEVRRKFVPLFEMDETRGDFRTVLERFARRFLDMLLGRGYGRLLPVGRRRIGAFSGSRTGRLPVRRPARTRSFGRVFRAAMERGELRQADASVAVTQFMDCAQESCTASGCSASSAPTTDEVENR